MKTFGKLMNTLCRGIVGYFSYLTTTNTNTIYSEYMLYEPILRILQAKCFSVYCEYPVQKTLGRGDHKKIDFMNTDKDDNKFAIEVKWAKGKKINVENDVMKLRSFEEEYSGSGYLLIFGRLQDIKELEFNSQFKILSKGKIVSWKSGYTQFAARWFRVS